MDAKADVGVGTGRPCGGAGVDIGPLSSVSVLRSGMWLLAHAKRRLEGMGGGGSSVSTFSGVSMPCTVSCLAPVAAQESNNESQRRSYRTAHVHRAQVHTCNAFNC